METTTVINLKIELKGDDTAATLRAAADVLEFGGDEVREAIKKLQLTNLTADKVRIDVSIEGQDLSENLRKAADIIDHINKLHSSEGASASVEVDIETRFEGTPDPALLEASINELGLPTRALQGLRRARIDTIGQLVSRSRDDVWAITNIGPGTVMQIEEALAKQGLHLTERD